MSRLEEKLAAAQVNGFSRCGSCFWCHAVKDRFPVPIRYDKPRVTQDFEVMGKEALFDSECFNERTDMRRLLHE